MPSRGRCWPSSPRSGGNVRALPVENVQVVLEALRAFVLRTGNPLEPTAPFTSVTPIKSPTRWSMSPLSGSYPQNLSSERALWSSFLGGQAADVLATRSLMPKS